MSLGCIFILGSLGGGGKGRGKCSLHIVNVMYFKDYLHSSVLILTKFSCVAFYIRGVTAARILL